MSRVQWLDEPGDLGAGPGPTKSYLVDMPFPWGADTEIVLPVQALVNDALNEMKPRVSELVNQAVTDLGPRLPAIAQQAANAAVPVAVRAVDERLPIWINEAAREIRPEARTEVNRALRRVYFVTAILAGGIGYLIWKTR